MEGLGTRANGKEDTGKHAFPADIYPNETIMVEAIIEDPPDEPREINKTIPKKLDALVMHMLEKKPKKRPIAEEILCELSQEKNLR